MRDKVTRLFVAVAVAEAFSWAGLLIGMVVKYGPLDNEIGVRVFGPIHGALFTAYCVLAVATAFVRRWGLLAVGVALVCGIPPFATLAFKRWAGRRGLLDVGTPAREPTPV